MPLGDVRFQPPQDWQTEIGMGKNMDRLHIGGRETKAGWKIFNVQPADNVDFVGNIQDLSMFADGSWDEIYASHVLEHVPQMRMMSTVKGLYRILKPGGKIMISVPDLETLCRLFTHPQMSARGRFDVMTIMFGGQADEFDFHYVGLSWEILSSYLADAGFSRIERVSSFGLFDDFSNYAPYLGIPVSLNTVAYRDS
jgi:predicted SAM-dependent methyltransferase